MVKKIILLAIFTLMASAAVYAVDNTKTGGASNSASRFLPTKPATHNTTWERQHGQAAKANEADCMSCHEERLECIGCHEDMAPRNHSIAWVQKNHGLESRWNRMQCATCHKEDFCSSCHEEATPLSHSRAGFGTFGNVSFHCNTSCQLPVGTWKNTVSKNCIVCHKSRPILQTGGLHAIN